MKMMSKALLSSILIASFLLIYAGKLADGCRCSYCIANPDASDALVQEKLDFVCGQLPESCALIQPGGPCYVPNNLKATASQPFDDWYVGGAECDFEGAEILVDKDPSHGDCIFRCR